MQFTGKHVVVTRIGSLAHLYTFSMQQFHLTCVLERPVEGEVWFCDDECHSNSGFRSKKCCVA